MICECKRNFVVPRRVRAVVKPSRAHTNTYTLNVARRARRAHLFRRLFEMRGRQLARSLLCVQCTLTQLLRNNTHQIS